MNRIHLQHAGNRCDCKWAYYMYRNDSREYNNSSVKRKWKKQDAMRTRIHTPVIPSGCNGARTHVS